MIGSTPKITRRHAMGGALAAASALATERWRLLAQGLPAAPVQAAGNNSAIASNSRVWAVGKETLAHRTRLMRELMEREQFDALVFSSGIYLKFAVNLSGFVGGEAVCVVPRDGSSFLILPSSSVNAWRFQALAQRPWTSDVTFAGEAGVAFKDALTAKVEKAGLRRARIGVETAVLRSAFEMLPDVHADEAARQIDALRLVKSREEIAVMREAASLADWVQARYRENIRPGRLVGELDAAMTVLGYQEATRRFPDADVTIPCWTLSGPISASPHGAGTTFGNLSGARIEKGHVLISNVYPSLDGVPIENERTWICGKPSRRQAELFEAVLAAQEAGCEAVVTGRPIAAIDSSALAVFERLGFDDLVHHRTGHGLGLAGHDEPIDMAFNTDPIPQGMVVSVEPSLLDYGLGGFRIDDTVAAAETAQILTRSPKDLQSQTIA
jgi:Xaa-Pro aminopeptidase